MNKIVAANFIPGLGNGRPENGTETQTFQSCAQWSFTPLQQKREQNVRLAHMAEPYVLAAATAFFDFFSAPLDCPPSFFDLRVFFSAASSTS